ncbi:hypothetical protein MHYP_G00237500 [Metynnis hypsauchen]
MRETLIGPEYIPRTFCLSTKFICELVPGSVLSYLAKMTAVVTSLTNLKAIRVIINCLKLSLNSYLMAFFLNRRLQTTCQIF